MPRESRIKNIAELMPDAIKAAQTLAMTAHKAGVPARTLGLLELRASQINGCSICVDMHARHLKKAGETDERLFAIAAWRDTPYYTDAERAALALAESLTRIADSEDPVPDAVWNEAARHYDAKGLAALVVAIATINVWNRFNVATRQIVGSVSW